MSAMDAKRSCPHVRYLYRSAPAQKEYKTLLSEAREGIPLNKESFYEDDRIITSGLQRGQHIYHIQANNPLHSSKSTIYRHFHKASSPYLSPQYLRSCFTFSKRSTVKKLIQDRIVMVEAREIPL